MFIRNLLRSHITISLGAILSAVSVVSLIGMPHLFLAPRSTKPKIRSFVVTSDQIFEEKTTSGKNVFCLKKGDAGIPGSIKIKNNRTYFTSSTNSNKTKLEKLNAKKSSYAPAKFKKLVKKLRSTLKEEVLACATLPDFSLTQFSNLLSEKDVHTLYRRAGFIATVTELKNCLNQTAEFCVDRIMNAQRTPLLTALPNKSSDGTPEDNLQATIDYYLIGSPNQFWSKQVLDLLDMYAIRLNNQGNAYFSQENAYIRPEVIQQLLKEIFDAAETGDRIALNTNIFFNEYQQNLYFGYKNTKNSSNDMLARSYLSRFSLGATNDSGVPNYNSTDIAELARAFTGYSAMTNYVLTDLLYTPSNADLTQKTLWSNTPWQKTVVTAREAIEAMQSHPEWARHLARRMLQRNLSSSYPASMVEALAKIIREDSGNVTRAFKTLFTSKAMFAQGNRNTIISSNAAIAIKIRRFFQQFGVTSSIYRGVIAQSGSDPIKALEVNLSAAEQYAAPLMRYQLKSFLFNSITESKKIAGNQDWNTLSMLDQMSESQKYNSTQVVNFVSSTLLGVDLSTEMKEQLIGLLDHTLTSNGTLVVRPWDPTNAGAIKLLQLLSVLASSEQFLMD